MIIIHSEPAFLLYWPLPGKNSFTPPLERHYSDLPLDTSKGSSSNMWHGVVGDAEFLGQVQSLCTRVKKQMLQGSLFSCFSVSHAVCPDLVGGHSEWSG